MSEAPSAQLGGPNEESPLSRPVLPLLADAGRLLLEYNESTGQIHRSLTATARALIGDECEVAVTYGGVAVELAAEGRMRMSVRELRYNAALQARVHTVLRQLQCRKIDVSTALDQLQRVERETPAYSWWLSALMLGLAGASLAVLLGADRGTVIVTGVATSLGLVVRQELGRRHFSLLTLPFAGGFVGAVLGGIAIRLGWTRTPGLALIVPSLMLVPGPHLINGLLDLVDNYVPMSIARLALAASILVAIALGVVLGIELTLPDLPRVEQNPNVNCPNVVFDVLLAAVVTIGFALYYNTDWGHIGIATAGGMAGHGLRFLALESGWGLVPATFLGGVAVGLVAAWASRSYKAPIAVMAFAGAVTMMPGVQIYPALSGSLRLARQDEAAGLPLIAGTLGDAFQACLIVIALAIGLIISSRFVLLMAREEKSRKSGSTGSGPAWPF